MSVKTFPLVAAIFAVLVCSGVAASQQRATIRFNPQRPLQANPETSREQDDFLRMLDENDPTRRNRLLDDLLSDYPTSEFTHMFLQSRWEIRLGRDDPQDIIDTALEGLDAYDYFMERKLGFIDEPTSPPDYPTEQYRLASQQLQYHQSIIQAATDLAQIEQVAQHTELGLAAAENADEWYGQLGEDADEIAGMDSEAFAELSLNARMFMLNNMRSIYQESENTSGVIEIGERMLEVIPEDVELLLNTSALMVQEIPEDPTARTELMERARDYSDRAVDGIDLFLLRSDLTDEQQAGVRAELYGTMGLASIQLGDWGTAIAAYRAATNATPGAPNMHYMLGLAGANAQDIDVALPAFARAHYLAPEIAEVRTTLEQLYEAKEGTLDGLEAYIQSEGTALGF